MYELIGEESGYINIDKMHIVKNTQVMGGMKMLIATLDEMPGLEIIVC